MKKTGTFTEKQINRLPDEGYYLEYFQSHNPNANNRPTACCIKNGEVKYIHYGWGDSWCTLMWTCMATRNQITKRNESKKLNGDKHNDYYYEYYKTHAEMIAAHPELDSAFQSKAPNDF